MKIGTPKEIFEGEDRVAMTPASAKELHKLGYECVIEGVKTPTALYKAADIVAKVRPPSDAEVKKLREGQTLISFFYPAQNEKLMEAAN